MLFTNTIEDSTLDLLIKIQNNNFFNNCRLVGGTALALQLGHRKSVDLDFFGNFDTDPLLIKDALATTGNLQIIQESKFIFQYIINGIKVDFVNYPYPWLFDSVNETNIILADKRDIAAMKLSAITNRGTKKDFIDLYELLKIYTLKQMLDFYSEKYKQGIPFMTLKSLTYFEDAEPDPMPYMFSDCNWEIVKTEILNNVRMLSV